MYKTLDQWFESPNTNKKHQKTFFYFDSNTLQSVWLLEKPTGIRYTTIVKWSNHMPIMLCTNLKKTQYEIPKDEKYNIKHISFLKSNLQKCIRRQLNDKAIETAYHMIKIDINEFLRRLSIIILEDVKLHESYSTLVWLMSVTSSTKGIFKPTKYIIDWLLGLINTLCNINEYDDYDDDGDIKCKNDITDFNDYDLIYSMCFRCSYGGMDGDIDMLDYFVRKWFERFNKGDKCNLEPINLIDSSKIKPLINWKLEGNNMAGIDFHCAPNILEILYKEYNLTKKDIKITIWKCSSSVNKRKPYVITDNNIIIWGKIENRYYELQNGIFNNVLNKNRIAFY